VTAALSWGQLGLQAGRMVVGIVWHRALCMLMPFLACAHRLNHVLPVLGLSIELGSCLCMLIHNSLQVTVVQLLGNHGPLSQRDPGQVFEKAARNCKIPIRQH
jgi:hypothetical protein